MKIGVIIQARMGSSRLPGKVLNNLVDKPVLRHVVDRVSQAKLVDTIIIATTDSEKDDALADFSINNKVAFFRGSEQDVLSRYYYAAKENELDVIVRVTSDCPLIDPNVIDDMIRIYLDGDFQVVSNATADISLRSFPRGFDTEIFSMKSLEKAFFNAKEKYQREHVTPYIYENEKNIKYHMNKSDYSKYRLTLDTDEDYTLIKKIYSSLYKGKHDFYLKEIVDFMEDNPELLEINSHIEQKSIKETEV